MMEYSVEVGRFTYREIIENEELFNELRVRCENLVGKTVYLNSMKMDITIEAWYDRDNIEDNSKSLILVYTCDNIVDEPCRVLPELKFVEVV